MMLKVENLSKQFNGHLILDQINFEVKEGEFVAIMGSSGSGKSTLLYAVSGMDQIETGKVTLDGHSLDTLTQDQLAEIRLSKMGFVFQKPYLFNNLTVLDNVIYPALNLKQMNRQKIEERGLALLQDLQVAELADRDPKALSGGQYQRIAIARALMNDPTILFADEPTGALNSKMSQEVMTIFKKINQTGTSVIMVTHDMNAAAHAKRVLFLKDGQIMRDLAMTSDQTQNLKAIGTVMESLEI
ncbi:ABC transporter ATP-binding protein [Facklamia languida]